MIKQFLRDESGTETVEWGILAGLIVAGLVAAFAAIGTWVHGKITGLQADLEAN